MDGQMCHCCEGRVDEYRKDEEMEGWIVGGDLLHPLQRLPRPCSSR